MSKSIQISGSDLLKIFILLKYQKISGVGGGGGYAVYLMLCKKALIFIIKIILVHTYGFGAT